MVKLELITDYDMFVMVEKGVRGGCFKQYIGMLKQTISIWKIIIKACNPHI